MTFDPQKMGALIDGFPDMLRTALDSATRWPSLAGLDAGSVTSVVVAGMGGSAIGGDLVAAALRDALSVPLVVVRDYGIPAFVGPATLVIVSTHSGNTEETLSVYDEAVQRGARVLVISSGGEATARAGRLGHPALPLVGGMPPRAALGYSFGALLLALGRAGLVPDQTAALTDATAEIAELTPIYAATDGPADQLAAQLVGRLPMIYAGAPLAAVARRWAGQLAENAKTLAHWAELPEMNHNEIVGWERNPDLLARTAAVFLHSSDDDERINRRMAVTQGLVRPAGGVVLEATAVGTSRLARLLALVHLGDWTSYHLARRTATDPTPIVKIDQLKAALAV